MAHKYFIVNLLIRAGEYEKSGISLIQAEDEMKAGKLALEGECHYDLENVYWENGGVYDAQGEFFYRVKSCKEVPAEHVPVLLQYI